MLLDHVESGARCTVGCIEVPRMEATALGVMHIDERRRITAFLEKPKDPPAMPGKPDRALGSMGIYVFNADYLYQLLEDDLALRLGLGDLLDGERGVESGHVENIALTSTLHEVKLGIRVGVTSPGARADEERS